MKMRLYPNRILRKKAARASRRDAEELYGKLVAEMINYEGIGLAAPQVGIDKSIAVISDKYFDNLDRPLLLLNPRVVKKSGSQSIEEACLSVKGVSRKIKRALQIEVETGPDDDRKIIEASGLLAIVMQHEIDHLNGIVFVDRAPFPARCWLRLKAKINKKKKESESGCD